MNESLKVFLISLALTILALVLVSRVFATTSNYGASEWSQWCADHSDTCAKEDGDDVEEITTYCPSDNQTPYKVLVHAGGGQTVYELPHEGFDYVIEGDHATVTRNGHPNGLSWVMVKCEGTRPTVTPTVTPTGTLTPTATPTPTDTPTPTPTEAVRVTPTVTPTPPMHPQPCNFCDPTPTPMPPVYTETGELLGPPSQSGK